MASSSTALALSGMATGAIWIGAIILAIAVGGFVAFLIASGALAAGKKPKIVVPVTGGARPAGAAPAAAVRPNPAGGAVLRPIVPVVVGQEDSPPAYPAASGCGHELNGNRFCTVCGRPAADDGRRDIFAAEPTVSASSAEITTVLPVFASAEPADLTVRMPDRPSEWSLASVTSGPPTGLADRPAVPGPRAGLADRPPVPDPVAADRPAVPGPLAGLADRPPVSAPAWADRPPVPAPSAGLADRPPVPAPLAVPTDRPPVPAPVAVSADRPLAPRGAVSASPPWAWADPPPAPGSIVSSAPPGGQAEPSPAAPDGKVSSGPPWESAERLPAPGGAKPDPGGDGTGPRQSGRHRSRRP